MYVFQKLLAITVLLASGAVSAEVRIFPQDSGVKVRLRGISAVSADIAWASGGEGTVLRTIDGGKQWQAIKVPGAEALDFRDIEGIDAGTAVALSIGPGEASRVYRTQDAGKTWTLALQNRDPRAFFDCMVFEGNKGWMLGDPVEGKFQIYVTHDGGRNWQLSSGGPPAYRNEAAFAASGTCIARIGNSLVIGTGGFSSRIWYMADDEVSWEQVPSSMFRFLESAGVFSMSPIPGTLDFVAVGGDYKKEDDSGNAAIASHATLQTLHPEERHAYTHYTVEKVSAPIGYRSGVACTSRKSCLAVGPSGVDLWNGAKWSKVSSTGHDAIDMVGNIGWVSGDLGRIGRIEFRK